MPWPLPKPILTVRQAADMVGVHANTIRAWVAAEKVPCWRTLGGHIRIPREFIEKNFTKRY